MSLVCRMTSDAVCDGACADTDRGNGQQNEDGQHATRNHETSTGAGMNQTSVARPAVYRRAVARSSTRWCFQSGAMVWLPWPRVLSENGTTTALPRGTRVMLALEHAQFRRIDKVVGEVDGEQRHA